MDRAAPTASERETAPDATSTLGAAVGMGVMASLTIILLGVLQAKITALLLGPHGVGSLAEVRQVVASALVPLGALAGASFVAAIGDAHGRADVVGIQRVYDVASTALVVSALVLGGIVVGLATVILPADWGPHRPAAVALAAIATFGMTWLTLTSLVLLATRELRASLYVNVIAAAAALAGAGLGTLAGGASGQLLGMAIAPWVAWPLARVVASRRHRALRWLPRLAVHGATLRRLAFAGLGAVIAGFALQGALSTIRWTLHAHAGVAANGQFQAAWSIGVGYLAVVLGSVGNVIFPRYAAARSAAEIEHEVEHASRYVMTFAPPIILIAIAIRQPAMKLLFTGDFALAGEVLGLQMAADLAKALAYVQAGPLLYRNHLRAFLITEVIAAALLAGASLALVPRFGLVATGYGYFAAYFAYLVLTTWFVERACGIRTDRRRQLAALGFCALAAAAVLVTARWPWVNVGVGLAGIGWGLRGGLHVMAVQRVRRVFRRR